MNRKLLRTLAIAITVALLTIAPAAIGALQPNPQINPQIFTIQTPQGQKQIGLDGFGGIKLPQLPIPTNLIPLTRVGMIDIALGNKEQQRFRSISGTISDPSDRFIAAKCDAGECPHIEITDLTTQEFSGFAWLDSRLKAKDGYGPLCLPFGCKGPVGNHPFGKAFRVVMTQPNEAKGTIRVGLKFRVCKTLFGIKSCTPYVFPPGDVGLPLGELKEETMIPFLPPGQIVGGADFNAPGLNPDKTTIATKSPLTQPVDGWCDPLPGGIQTSPFGEFPHGNPPHVHQGVDIAGIPGALVLAARDGMVVDVVQNAATGQCQEDPGGGFGNVLTISHDQGFTTLYAHNQSVLVSPGESVKCGQPIAVQGSTGCSTGDHSHFEVRLTGSQISPRSAGVPNIAS